jgi:hypothetical protein
MTRMEIHEPERETDLGDFLMMRFDPTGLRADGLISPTRTCKR